MGDIFRPHTNTRKWLIGIGVVLLAAILTVVVYVVFFHKSAKPAPQAYNPHREQIGSLEKSGPPVEPQQQLSYYSQLAQHYDDLNDRQNALKNYLKAQSIEDGIGDQQVAFYLPIADIYRIQNNKAKATEYYRKEIGYLQHFAEQQPAQADSIHETIKLVQGKIDSL